MIKTEDLILKAKKEDKIVLGSTQTLKKLKLGKAKAVVVSGNASENIRKDIEHYADMNKVELHVYKSSKDLGTLIGKPFNVSALVIVK